MKYMFFKKQLFKYVVQKNSNDDFNFKFNFFIKNGLKIKFFNFFFQNLGWLFFYNKQYYTLKYKSANVMYKNLNTYLNDIFSFKDLTIFIKYVRLSRKIRKYTKNKVRYRGFIYLLKKNQFNGYAFRMWRVIYLYLLSKNVDDQYNIKRLKKPMLFDLCWFNLKDIDNKVTPTLVQYNMIEKIVKRKRN